MDFQARDALPLQAMGFIPEERYAYSLARCRRGRFR